MTLNNHGVVNQTNPTIRTTIIHDSFQQKQTIFFFLLFSDATQQKRTLPTQTRQHSTVQKKKIKTYSHFHETSKSVRVGHHQYAFSCSNVGNNVGLPILHYLQKQTRVKSRRGNEGRGCGGSTQVAVVTIRYSRRSTN